MNKRHDAYEGKSWQGDKTKDSGSRMRRRYGIFSAILFFGAVLVYLFYPTDENRIRKVIRNGEKAAVAEDIDGLMDSFSYNYIDDYGNGYLKLKKRFEAVFKRLDNIEIEKNLRGITIDESRAEAEIQIRVIASSSSGRGRNGQDKKYIIGYPEDTETIKVSFAKSPHKWLITGFKGLENR
jgi:hypothetical protein